MEGMCQEAALVALAVIVMVALEAAEAVLES
jgi:hypothetical protein